MNTAQRSILYVDDSETERKLVTAKLEQAGYDVLTAPDGRAGLRCLYECAPDLVLLDVVMPELDGWDTLERIREVSEVPVIMLTGRNVDKDRVRGLRAGADDYIGKPFTPDELLARIEAVLRRTPAKPGVREIYDDGTVMLDPDRLQVRVRGEEVALTPNELRLLDALLRHPDQVLSRTQLTELAWDEPFAVSEEQVKVYIGYLRRKLERDPARPELIETVRGFGYRYRKPA
jgi:DNA-binding response OmpR family regulator